MIGPGDREGEGLRVKGPFRGARHNSRLERTGSAPAAQPGRSADEESGINRATCSPSMSAVPTS